MTDKATRLALRQLQDDAARILNLKRIPAILGDANGAIYDTQNPGSGYVIIRRKTSNGYSIGEKARGPYAGATVTMRPGVPVELEYDKDGILYVAHISFQDSLVAGSNPLAANASDQAANSFVSQTDIITLISTPTAPPSTSVALRGWKPIVRGTFYDFPGALVDLSSFIPSAGNHRVAVIFLKSDFATIEVKASTTKSMADPIMPADIQEAVTARTSGSLALWAWRLHDAQTTIVDADRFLDMRQVWNLDDGVGVDVTDGSTTVTRATEINFTSNATVTDAGNGVANVAITGGGGGGSAPPSTCQGRLTLTTGTPITTSDVTAATTVYFTPYKGNQIGTYSGAAWTISNFSEKSLSLSGFTSDTNYDIFIVDGTLVLEAVAWTNDTTRATALTLQDGIYVKSGATTRRYLGTIRITGTTGQCEDSFTKRYCWNYYNRTRRIFRRLESTDSWTYTGNWRSMNNSTANRIAFVRGLNEDSVIVTAILVATSTVDFATGLGLDSTSTPTTQIGMYGGNSTASANPALAQYEDYPSVGFHYLQQMEKSSGTTTTFYGDAGIDYMQSGLSGNTLG